MNPPNSPTGKPYSFLMNKERPLSRQNPLKVNKESRKITKNPPLKSIKQIEEPRVIYTIPQRVIHVTPNTFKDVVQSLTGIENPTGVAEVSPASSLAPTERTSNGDDDMTRMWDNGVQVSQFPGLLLPDPPVLPPLPYENFLPPALPQKQYNNYLPPVLPQYNNFLPPVLPQRQYNNFLPPRLPQRRYNNFLPATLPKIRYNNSLPAPLPPVTTENLMQEIFPPANNVPMQPPDTFFPDTWKEKPSDIFSPVTLPQSGIFSPVTLPQSDIFSPETMLATQSDNFLPDNCHPSDILSSDTCQPSDTFSPVTLPSTQSGNLSPDNWSPSDILSEDTWSPSDILSPATATLPSTLPDTFSADPWQPIQSDIFSPVPLPPTSSDTGLSSDTFSPETLQPKPYEVFSPVLGRQSQTVLPYDNFWPENNSFPKPPEFIPATPSKQFNSFYY